MEHALVIGILDIVEDKLREFDLQIPDDTREDNSDPIVGYQYAELHDRILEYLEGEGVIPDRNASQPHPFQGHTHAAEPAKSGNPIKIYGMSVVNSDGYSNGTESKIAIYTSLRDCLDASYDIYVSTWESLEADDVIRDGHDSNGSTLLSKEAFEAELLSYGYSYIQLSGSHIQFEFFEQEVELQKGRIITQEAGEKQPFRSQLQSASQRAGSSGFEADPVKSCTEPER